MLLETKNRKGYMEKVRRRIGYDEIYVIQSIGKIRDMGLFWKNEGMVIKVEGHNLYSGGSY